MKRSFEHQKTQGTKIKRNNLNNEGLNLKKRISIGTFSLCLICFLYGCLGTEQEELFSSDKGGCSDNAELFRFELTTDSYAYETSWELFNTSTNRRVLGGPPRGTNYADQTRYVGQSCLQSGTYELTIYDDADDGICCRYGRGNYKVYLDGEEIHNGGRFTDEETVSFEVSSSSDDSLSGRSAEWLQWTNQYRADHGVDPYSWNWGLANSAEAWAQNIADTMSCSLPSNPNSSHDPNWDHGENITSRSGGWSHSDAPVYNLVYYRFGTSPVHERALLRNWHYKMGCGMGYNEERNCRVYVCRYSP